MLIIARAFQKNLVVTLTGSPWPLFHHQCVVVNPYLNNTEQFVTRLCLWKIVSKDGAHLTDSFLIPKRSCQIESIELYDMSLVSTIACTLNLWSTNNEWNGGCKIPVSPIKLTVVLRDVFPLKIMLDKHTKFTFSIFAKIHAFVCFRWQSNTNWIR